MEETTACIILRNERIEDLYRDGMTTKEANAAAKDDPRVKERIVRTFLRNELKNDREVVLAAVTRDGRARN